MCLYGQKTKVVFLSVCGDLFSWCLYFLRIYIQLWGSAFLSQYLPHNQRGKMYFKAGNSNWRFILRFDTSSSGKKWWFGKNHYPGWIKIIHSLSVIPLTWLLKCFRFTARIIHSVTICQKEKVLRIICLNEGQVRFTRKVWSLYLKSWRGLFALWRELLLYVVVDYIMDIFHPDVSVFLSLHLFHSGSIKHCNDKMYFRET